MPWCFNTTNLNVSMKFVSTHVASETECGQCDHYVTQQPSITAHADCLQSPFLKH